MGRVLCVAEKPSIAKAVALALGGHYQTESVPRAQYCKNYRFDYRFQQWGMCSVTSTSVAGHIMSQDFDASYRNWAGCDPAALFEADIKIFVNEERENPAIAKNIEQQARQCDILFIWTDCDREGEHIGTEVKDIARKANPRLQVKRAKFSNVERSHLINAARVPIDLDQKQADAVAARIEIDLRLGAAFTRLQTLALKPLIDGIDPELKVISYGSCQFPTLGFVVDRYFRVKNFVPETFWYIKMMHTKDDVKVNFSWARNHLFDRMAVVLFFERCLVAKEAKATKMQERPTSKWRPLPLTTVELQKCGSRFLRMTSQRVMTIAEKLYQQGFISYPRTETDQFGQDMDLRAIIEKQRNDGTWGPYAQMLLNGGFNQPRNGRNNDQAHPPIHPVNHTVPSNDDERRVYEFVVRRFLACCSEDAKGRLTELEVSWAAERFTAKGLAVLERNYLDVYPYDKWTSSQPLPRFTVGETFEPTEANIEDGKTSPPHFITEPELITLMDVNGIGTDATMAEHIEKIQQRKYVMTRSVGRAQTPAANADDQSNGNTSNARNRGARGGARVGAALGGVNEFIPTTLGVALIVGYDKVGFDTSLGKPFLRKKMELQMKAICAGTRTRQDVVHESLEQYREAFTLSRQQMNVLKKAIRKYVLQEDIDIG